MRKLMSFLVTAFSVLAASAQTSIQVQAPNLVGVNEQFTVTFVIDGEHSQDNFQCDPGSDFQLVWGPQKGTSTSVNIINGKIIRILYFQKHKNRKFSAFQSRKSSKSLHAI